MERPQVPLPPFEEWAPEALAHHAPKLSEARDAADRSSMMWGWVGSSSFLHGRKIHSRICGHQGQQMDFTWISPMPIMPIAQNICGSGFPISTRSFGGNMPQSRIEARPEPEHSGHFERWPSCPFRGYFYKLITFW